jgi:hypothetical protein
MRLVPKSEQNEAEPEENIPSEQNIYTQNLMIDD